MRTINKLPEVHIPIDTNRFTSFGISRRPSFLTSSIKMQPEHRSAEVVVIGAGIGGLAAAKTYLELSPLTNLILLEKVSP